MIERSAATERTGSGSDARRAWLLGGVLLLAGAVIGWAPADIAFAFGAAWTLLAALATTGALLVFAFGVRAVGSVTARRPLGTGALALLGVWLLVGRAVSPLLVSDDPSEFPWFAYADLALRFVLAVVSVVEIGRSGAVPVPWQWAPAWTLLAVVAAGVVSALAAALPSPDQAFLISLVGLQRFVGFAAPVFLGILAIVLSTRLPRTVRVYP